VGERKTGGEIRFRGPRGKAKDVNFTADWRLECGPLPAGLRDVTRRLLLTGSFCLLIAALVLMWNHRYERVEGLPGWNLAMLRQDATGMPGVEWVGAPENPALRLGVDGHGSRVALRMALPGSPAVESLLVKFRLRARGLKPGRQKWEMGRFMIQWHPPVGGGAMEKEPIGGIKLNEDTGNITLVAIPVNAPAVPALVMEHLGSAGEFDLTDLEIIPVRERMLWKTGRWVMLSASFLWLAACIRRWRGVDTRRACAAAAIFLVMFVEFVVPGPWKVQRPLLVRDFRIGESVATEQALPLVKAASPLAISSGAISPSGDVPLQGGVALRVKLVLARFRLLLHVALLAAPTLAFALLLGRRNALLLAIPLALATELAQVAFGYGCDWVDGVDLAFDTAGIALGLWLGDRMRRLLWKPANRP
jgi:hypothetical protein